MFLRYSKLSCSQIKKVKWLNTEYPTEHSIKLKTTKMLEIRLIFKGRSDGSCVVVRQLDK